MTLTEEQHLSKEEMLDMYYLWKDKVESLERKLINRNDKIEDLEDEISGLEAELAEEKLK